MNRVKLLYIFALLVTCLLAASPAQSDDQFDGMNERRAKFIERCRENPDNDRCRFAKKKQELRRICKANPEAEECRQAKSKFRERVRAYCSENPDSRRCKKMKRHHQERRRQRAERDDY